MRIAFLVNDFPAISETFILDQITWLIERGCAVDVYAQRLLDQNAAHPEVAAHSLMDRAFELSVPSAASERRRIGHALWDIAFALPKGPGIVARALRWGRSSGDALGSFYRVLPFLAREPYDVVHCHFGPNGLLGVDLRDMGAVRAPILTQFWGYDVSSHVRSRGEGVYRHLFAKGDLFLCVSEQMRARVVALGCDPHKTRIQYAGVKVKNIAFAPCEPGPHEGIRLLTVGRLVEKKGIAFALRTVARLIGEYPNLQYTIIGEGPDREVLTSLVRELGVGSHVSFVGAKTREVVAAMMRNAHILLAPSVSASSGDEEGIPLVLMEALASGLPVVSTFHAGIPELVTHRVSGLLAPERDPEALAEQVRFLITHPSERRAMAVAGRQAVESGFDVDVLNAQLLALYEECEKRGARP